MKLLPNARFLAWQGLALRGDGDEADSNFMRLPSLRAEDFPQLREWIQKRTRQVRVRRDAERNAADMAVRVLHGVVDCIQQKPFCTVMADETADAANVEQVVVCLRWVDKSFRAQEQFIGFMKLAQPELRSSTM